uniref:Uncharacterized protein n=1 Tax=Anguilla anguilla TaxID=7936 RepID=A0A0E9SYF6_ANGAN
MEPQRSGSFLCSG